MEVTPRHPDRIAAARLAIINRDRLKAELLHFYCTHRWGFEVVAIEFTGTSGIAALAHTRPDLVLVSLPLPDLTAAEMLKQAHTASPTSRLIGQLDQCSDYLLHCLADCVYHGLMLDADESVTSLGEAIERARQGLRMVSPRITQGQIRLRTSPDSFPKLLSPREQEILVCIAHAMSDAEIGQACGVSKSTALSHRRQIMRKVGIHSTPRLIHYCAERGFNSVPPPRAPQP